MGTIVGPWEWVMDADEEAEKGQEQVYHLPQELVITMPRSALVRDGTNFPPGTTVCWPCTRPPPRSTAPWWCSSQGASPTVGLSHAAPRLPRGLVNMPIRVVSCWSLAHITTQAAAGRGARRRLTPPGFAQLTPRLLSGTSSA